MPRFSPQAITALVQVITGGHGQGSSGGSRIGRYRTGTELEMFLGNFGLELHIGMKSRTQAVRDLLTNVNQSPEAIPTLSPLFVAAVNPFDYSEAPERHAEALAYLNAALRADGRELVDAGDRYRLLAFGATSAAAEAVREAADMLDLDTVRHHLDDALALVGTKPDGAIRAACSTVESVSGSILERLGVPLPADRSISPLFREVARQLSLSPDRPDLTPDLKQILGGLANVVAGIGALRTHAGDAHGQPAGTPQPDSCMARLAVHAASAACEFLILRWQNAQGRGSTKL